SAVFRADSGLPPSFFETIETTSSNARLHASTMPPRAMYLSSATSSSDAGTSPRLDGHSTGLRCVGCSVTGCVTVRVLATPYMSQNACVMASTMALCRTTTTDDKSDG